MNTKRTSQYVFPIDTIPARDRLSGSEHIELY